MSFLDIKDPANRATLVKEYVTVTKTVKRRNMVNREMKLAFGDERQTIFHPILNATKHVAEETRKELAHMKKTLTDIDGALAAQRVDDRLPLSKNTEQDSIYGFGCHASENRVNIMSVNSILVHCNIIHSSYMRGT